jgi:SHS2 domain-containing protein
MPYEYLDDVAIADAAFRAWGQTPEEMFSAAADAVTNVMVADLETVSPEEQLTIELQSDAMDMLLFELLQELVFYKDARQLLLRVPRIRILQGDGLYTLSAEAFGESINPEKHELIVDVKAITLHRFSVEETSGGWEARVIVDV